MGDNIKKFFLQKYFPWLCLIIFIGLIFVLPNFLSAAETITLNPPSPSCLVSTLQITLTWISTITGSPTYDVWRKEGAGSYIKITPTSLPTGTTQYIDNTAFSGKTYIYQIRAVRGGDNFNSTEQTTKYYCRAVLSSATPRCELADGPHVALTWGPGASGDLLEYEIYRDNVKIGQTSDTSFDDNQNRIPGLEGTKNYNAPGYIIRTRWQDGTFYDSTPVPATALACAPKLTANSGCSNDATPGGPKVDLSWNNLLGVSEYQIYRKAPNEPNPTLFKTLPSSQASYTDYLVDSLPDSYYQTGDISYYVKAVWPNTEQKDSDITTRSISQCPPFLTVNPSCGDIAPYDPLMSLSWTATRGATVYYIYRDNVYKTSASELSYIDPSPCSGLSCTKGYYVKAIVGTDSYNSQTVSKDVNCSIVPTPSTPVLAEPSTFCSSDLSYVALSWTSSSYANYYKIYYVGMPPEGIKETTQTSLDYHVQGGLDYEFYVRAVGAGGVESDASATQPIHAVSCFSPSASTLTLNRNCNLGKPYVDLSWTETTNTEAYEIWRGFSPTSLSLLTTFNKSNPEFNSRAWRDNGVTASTNYYYKIVSKGPTGVSPTNSLNTPQITTLSCAPNNPPLGTPSPACVSTNPVLNLDWSTHDPTNTDHYEIFRQNPGGNLVQIVPYLSTATKTWQDNTGLLPQTLYNYRVDAVGYEGVKESSDLKSATTNNCTPPGSFTLYEPTPPPSSSPPFCQGAYPRYDLSWTSASSATSYDVLRNTSAVANTTDTSYTDWGLGNALNFSGGWVNIEDSPSLRVAGDLTISFWAYPTNISYGGQNPLGKSSYGEFYLSSGSNGPLYYYHGDGYSYMYCISDNIFTENNKWINIAIVRNVAAKSITIYKNGVAQPPPSCSPWKAPSASTQPLKIGYAGYNPWQGRLDEVRIYNRTMDAAEVSNQYKGIYNDSGAVGIWHFDEGSGTTVSDSTNNGNNGTFFYASWIPNGLQWQTNYSWQVKANSSGGNTLSNTTNPATVPICIPTKPGLTIQSSFCNGGLVNITLKWSFTTNTTRYEIYRQDKGLIKIITSTSTEFTLRTWTDTNDGAGLNQTTIYTYYIKAIGNVGESQSDPALNTTPDCNVSPAPQNLVADFYCNDSYPRIALSWNASANATYYSIYRKVGNGSYSFLMDTTGISFLDYYPYVTVNTEYSYYVVAYGPGGPSLPSIPVIRTTGYCLPATPSVTLTTGCENDTPFNSLSWSAVPTFNTFSYEIHRKKEPDSAQPADNAIPLYTIASTTQDFINKTWKDINLGLENLFTYYYWMRAVGPAGKSPFSWTKPIKTYSCLTPSTPSLQLNNTYCENNSPRVALSWNQSTNAYGYNIYRTNPNNSVSTYSTRLSPFVDAGSYALSFDGTDDYVSLGNSSSLNISSGQGMTVTAWVKTTDTQGLVASLRNSTNGNPVFDLSIGYNGLSSNPGHFIPLMRYDDGTGLVNIASSRNISDNAWHFVAAVLDQQNDTLKAYVDSNTYSTDQTADGSIITQADRAIGAERRWARDNYGTSAQTYLNGIVDDVKIYNRTLSAAELLEQYQQGIYDNDSGLVGVWHFDEGSGNTAFDSSGNANDGTIYNGTVPGASWLYPTGKIGDPSTVEEAQTYIYSVKAVGVDKLSNPSNEVPATALYCLPATPILEPIKTECSGNVSQLRLNWGPNDNNNTYYWSIYKRRADQQFPDPPIAVYAPETTYPDPDILVGYEYFYYLRPYGFSGAEGELSNQESGTATACADTPTKPIIQDVKPTCSGINSKMLISWDEDTSGKTLAFNVWRRKQGESDFSKITDSELSPSTTKYLDAVSVGEIYQYKIEAVGSGENNNSFSDPHPADPSPGETAINCTNIPPLPPYPLWINPEDIISIAGLPISVNLNWFESGNEKGYRIYRDGNQIAPIDTTGHIHDPSITQNYLDMSNVTFLADGQTYIYKVVAFNDFGQTPSNDFSVFVPYASPSPFTLCPNGKTDCYKIGNENKIRLVWEHAQTTFNAGPLTYQLYRNETNAIGSVPVPGCSITCSDPNYTFFPCPGLSNPIECFDQNPDSTQTWYFVKATAAKPTDGSNIRYSNIFQVGIPIPKWKELIPWF